jgi:hypothetical protein
MSLQTGHHPYQSSPVSIYLFGVKILHTSSEQKCSSFFANSKFPGYLNHKGSLPGLGFVVYLADW